MLNTRNLMNQKAEDVICEVGPEDWHVLWDHWIDNTDRLVKAYRTTGSGIIIEARLWRIIRSETPVYERLRNIGLSGGSARSIADLLVNHPRVICRMSASDQASLL